MDANSLSGLTAIASTLQDPRAANAVHPLASIFAIAVMAVVAGANTFLEIADWGEHNLDWLADALDLPRGIPSHDTFDRVFGLLEAAEAEKFHRRYLARLAEHGQTQPPIEGAPAGGSFRPGQHRRQDLPRLAGPRRGPGRRPHDQRLVHPRLDGARPNRHGCQEQRDDRDPPSCSRRWRSRAGW